MKKYFLLGALRFIAFGFLFLLLAGWLTMWLWNTILPPVLHVGTLTFWQAIGLLILSRLLFGNFKGKHRQHRHQGGKAYYMREKWAKMTPEEREQFKQQWRERCKK